MAIDMTTVYIGLTLDPDFTEADMYAALERARTDIGDAGKVEMGHVVAAYKLNTGRDLLHVDPEFKSIKTFKVSEQ